MVDSQQAEPDCGAASSEPLVSVIIVTWNSRKWLDRCIGSLLAQSYANLEIVVVDNASTDGTAAYIQDSYPTVRVIANPHNDGFAAGNNIGIGSARGELILLLNSDAWLGPEAVADLVSERATRKLDVIGPREADYWSRASRGPYTTHIDPWGHPVFRPGDVPGRRSFYLTGVCLLFSRALYEETGGLDDGYFMYCEEVDWFWRLNLTGKRFAYSDDVVVYHAEGGSLADDGSLSDVLNPQRFFWRNQGVLRMLLTNYRIPTLLWVLPSHLLQNVLEYLVFLGLGKRAIARTYVRAWRETLHDLPDIVRARSRAQANRVHTDRDMFHAMYIGPGKLHHLARRLHLYRRANA